MMRNMVSFERMYTRLLNWSLPTSKTGTRHRFSNEVSSPQHAAGLQPLQHYRAFFGEKQATAWQGMHSPVLSLGLPQLMKRRTCL